MNKKTFTILKTTFNITSTKFNFLIYDFGGFARKNRNYIFNISESNEFYFPEYFLEQYTNYNKNKQDILNLSKVSIEYESLKNKIQVQEKKITGQFSEICQIGMSIENKKYKNINKHSRNSKNVSRNGYDGILVDPEKSEILFFESKSSICKISEGETISKIKSLFKKGLETIYGIRDDKFSKVMNPIDQKPLDAKKIIDRVIEFDRMTKDLEKYNIANKDIVAAEITRFAQEASRIESENIFLDIKRQIIGITIFNNENENLEDIFIDFQNSIQAEFAKWQENPKINISKIYKILFDRINNEKLISIEINLVFLEKDPMLIIKNGIEMSLKKEWWNE
ncbi:hypothetical protein [Spiroplasma cantharicola]|uniref:Uncharacterized protein n=1 Tax=Spiroplasma cantharicola TaxID=362837 RepID=A0A0M5KEG9_9MOLU|nr:hypothetical protein [Spiroplasma cantharicola]ALD66376.1 hypothetical protein SCANT_v1c04700 [Spiroplasma cantharicola]